MDTNISCGELAQIFLKNGKNFLGILLNNPEDPSSFDQGVRYVAPNNVAYWMETSDEGLVEIVDTDHVEGIDLFLK